MGGRRRELRLVVGDFGVAAQVGAGIRDMDAAMRLFCTATIQRPLGNPEHLAPEVQAAYRRACLLDRNSTQRVAIPLDKQGSFATGAVLFELAMQGVFPLPDYATQRAVGPDPDDIAVLERQVEEARRKLVRRSGGGAGQCYAAVAAGLLAPDPAQRTDLRTAKEQLLQGLQS